MKLAGKIALITGGTGGIGLATAKLFLEHGAKVIITGSDEHEVGQAVAGLGDRAYGIVLDVTDLIDLEHLSNKVGRFAPTLDIVVPCESACLVQAFEHMSPEAFDENIATNLRGPLLTVQTLLPRLRDGGSIVFISSNLARRPSRRTAAYAASMAGLTAAARVLALEFGSRLRVNTMTPGPIGTEPAQGYFEDPDAVAETILAVVSRPEYQNGSEITTGSGVLSLL